MGVVGFLALSCTTLPACLRVTEGLWYKMATPLSLIHINLPKGGQLEWNAPVFFPLSHSFGWHQSSFPRAPWKTNCLHLESILQWCVRGGKYRNVHMIYVPCDFPYNCKENKRKNDLLLRTVLYIALISRHSLCKWKKCVIFFRIHQAFITLFVLLCSLLFHRLRLSSRSSKGQRASLCLSVSVFHLVCSRSFTVFKIWRRAFVPTKFLSNQDEELCLRVCVRRQVEKMLISGWVTCATTSSSLEFLPSTGT